MIDIAPRVAESLRARADEDIDVARLHAGALARAGTIRRRRMSAAAGVATVVAAAAVTASGISLPWPAPSGGTGGTGDQANLAAGAASEARTSAGRTTLPGLEGVPTAAEQPAAVGTDPAVLHLDVDLAALAAEASDWRSGPGYEGVTLRSPARQLDIYIGPDSAELEAGRPAPGPVLHLTDGTTTPLYHAGEQSATAVDGRPGSLQLTTFDAGDLDPSEAAPAGTGIAGIDLYSPELGEHTWVLRWQPVDGLHAIVQVHGGDQAAAFAAASTLRLDRVQRCVTPFQLTHVPDGTEWTECQISVRHQAGGWAWELGSVTLADDVVVHVEDAALADHPGDTAQITPNRTVVGQPAWWSTESPAGLYLPELGPVSVFVGGLGEPAATRLVEELSVAARLDRPETWPSPTVTGTG